MRWDIVYSLTADFASPTALGTALAGVKDTVTTNSYPSLGVPVAAGQTLYLRVYPYNTERRDVGQDAHARERHHLRRDELARPG